jgi:cytochrome c oxidase subunit 2
MSTRRLTAAALLLLPLCACEGVQSALDPAGRDAEILADLFWVMFWGAIVIWFFVAGLAVFLTRLRPEAGSPKLGHALIIGGGVVLPVVVLAALLAYSFTAMPQIRPFDDDPDRLRIHVVGERWWWRVHYHRPGEDAPIISANEVRLPMGERTLVTLESEDVIHSFWVPKLAGKMDMFPGRQTRIELEPTKTGTFRGQCAEFCGASHAFMAFAAVSMEADAFEAWLDKEKGPASLPDSPLAARGQDVFLSVGCGACHSIRGTPASGNMGPDLTHVGGRVTIGAGIMPTDPEAFAEWIAHTEAIKPEVAMPSFSHLTEQELAAIAAYLEGLD